MKNTIILSAAMTFATFGAFAQESSAPGKPQAQRAQGTADERAKHQTDKISSVAQLTPDQYTKVLAINKSFIEQREAVRNNGGSPEDNKSKMKALNDQREAQLKTIFTPEQAEKLKAQRKDFEGGHRAE